jgi:hypothetical protein
LSNKLYIFPPDHQPSLFAADLHCVKPSKPSLARDYGIMNDLKITKPQLVYSGDAAEALTCLITGPAHQRERRCRDQERQERPCSQWGDRKSKNNELSAQIGRNMKISRPGKINCNINNFIF